MWVPRWGGVGVLVLGAEAAAVAEVAHHPPARVVCSEPGPALTLRRWRATLARNLGRTASGPLRLTASAALPLLPWLFGTPRHYPECRWQGCTSSRKIGSSSFPKSAPQIRVHDASSQSRHKVRLAHSLCRIPIHMREACMYRMQAARASPTPNPCCSPLLPPQPRALCALGPAPPA